MLTFVETPIFTKEVHSFLPDDLYKDLQKLLLSHPEEGDVIKGSGGLRKIRWKLPGKGKRGGLRVIYYFDKPETIYMLFLYPKNEQEDLTAQQLKYLSTIMKEYLI